MFFWKNKKKLFLCHEKALIRIQSRICILQKGLDPDLFMKYTDLQHWYVCGIRILEDSQYGFQTRKKEFSFWRKLSLGLAI